MTQEEQQLEQELASLTPEELNEYESQLMAEADQPAPGQTHTIDPETKRAVPISPDKVIPEISGTDAFMLGAQEGIPFAKHAEAAGKALLDDTAVFSESYSRNLDEINEAMNEAEEKHPVAFNIGDFGIGMGLPAAKGYKAAMTMGALAGISRADQQDPWTLASGAVLGASAGALGLKVGKVAGNNLTKVGKKLGLISDGTTKEILVRSGNTEKVNQHIEKWYMKEGDDLMAGSTRFADDIMNMKVGGQKLIEGNDVPDTIYRKAKVLTSQAGRKLDEVLGSIDYKLQGDEVENAFETVVRQSGLREMLESPTEITRKKAEKLHRQLYKQFFAETGEYVDKKSIQLVNGVIETTTESVPKMKPKSLTFQDLVRMKRDFSDQSSVKYLNGAVVAASDNVEFWGNVTRAMSGLVPELAEQTGKIDKAALRILNRNYSTSKLVRDATKELAQKSKEGMLGKLRDLMTHKSMLLTTSMLAASAGVAGGSSFDSPGGAAVAATAATLASLALDPRSPQKFAIGLKKLSQNLQNPNYSKYIQKLSTTAGVSIDAFRDKLSSVSSQLYLEDSPVDRSNDSARENSQEILNIMRDEMPELTPVFRKALEDNDDMTISNVMEQLSTIESAKKFIKPGRGWNGVTFNPETKMKLNKEIESMDISRLQKSKLKQGLKLNSDEPGVIPQVEAEPDRFLQFRTRDKKRPQY